MFTFIKIRFEGLSALSPIHIRLTRNQGWQYGTVWYVGTVRYASIFAKNYGTLVRYAFFVMVRVRYALLEKVRVRYVNTQFELKIPDFSKIESAFCMQRQKTAEGDAKCIN